MKKLIVLFAFTLLSILLTSCTAEELPTKEEKTPINLISNELNKDGEPVIIIIKP